MTTGGLALHSHGSHLQRGGGVAGVKATTGGAETGETTGGAETGETTAGGAVGGLGGTGSAKKLL